MNCDEYNGEEISDSEWFFAERDYLERDEDETPGCLGCYAPGSEACDWCDFEDECRGELLI